MAERGVVEELWYGDGAMARAGRALLTPAARLFGAVVGARDVMYDAGWLASHESPIPVMSIGNLTVGGTGKTPLAAWLAREFAQRGARPAIVLRGYGGDEQLVHQSLNPTLPVVAGADRVAGVVEAARLGADIAVLDDAFQHRRARRDADLVLVSADRWTSDIRLLPAGPWREPLRAVRRATLVVVTRKAASESMVDAVNEAVAAVAPSLPRVSVRLEPDLLVRATGAASATGARSVGDAAHDPDATRPINTIHGESIHAVLSIADPRSFIRQLEAHGARVRASVFLDHHAFTDADIARVAGSLGDAEWVVCTLKDAVKLAPRWPRLAPPLWYVSQRVMVERGVGGLEKILDALVRLRSKAPKHFGTAG